MLLGKRLIMPEPIARVSFWAGDDPPATVSKATQFSYLSSILALGRVFTRAVFDKIPTFIMPDCTPKISPLLGIAKNRSVAFYPTVAILD
jgi:hypothetical protein